MRPSETGKAYDAIAQWWVDSTRGSRAGFAYLEKAIAIDDEIAGEVLEDEDFAKLRGDPRFDQLTKSHDERDDGENRA